MHEKGIARCAGTDNVQFVDSRDAADRISGIFLDLASGRCLERFDHFHKVRHFPKAISQYPRRLLSFSPIAPDVLPVHRVKDYPRIALDLRTNAAPVGFRGVLERGGFTRCGCVVSWYWVWGVPIRGR
jgi:hypothetical protein